MIAEPYICIKGSDLGRIEWFDDGGTPNTLGMQPRKGEHWQPYADFEREKLKSLKTRVSIHPHGGYCVTPQNLWSSRGTLYSADASGYKTEDFNADSESSRLLKRAEFLKAVCEKEGVEWLPSEKPRHPVCSKCGQCIK